MEARRSNPVAFCYDQSRRFYPIVRRKREADGGRRRQTRASMPVVEQTIAGKHGPCALKWVSR